MSVAKPANPNRKIAPMTDWLASSAILVGMMIAVWFAWSRFPHPREGGGLVLGAVAVAATLVFFAKSKAGLPIWPRAAGFAVTVLLAQVAFQLLAVTGLLKR